MDGIYLPDGRKLALIDRDWILDELPHLGNPDSNSDVNYLLATAAIANSGTNIGTGSLSTRTATGIGAGSTSHTDVGTGGATATTTTAATSATSTAVIHPETSAVHNYNLSYNPDEFESDLTLLSEIVDETQNKWSDFGLNQLLTPYARSTRFTPK